LDESHAFRPAADLERCLNPTFCQLYALEGRPSVPPEQLLLASLLQVFYGIRSERLLLEQLHYNLLFRWFMGLSPDDVIWHPTTLTKNRDRFLNDDVMGLRPANPMAIQRS